MAAASLFCVRQHTPPQLFIQHNASGSFYRLVDFQACLIIGLTRKDRKFNYFLVYFFHLFLKINLNTLKKKEKYNNCEIKWRKDWLVSLNHMTSNERWRHLRSNGRVVLNLHVLKFFLSLLLVFLSYYLFSIRWTVWILLFYLSMKRKSGLLWYMYIIGVLEHIVLWIFSLLFTPQWGFFLSFFLRFHLFFHFHIMYVFIFLSVFILLLTPYFYLFAIIFFSKWPRDIHY